MNEVTMSDYEKRSLQAIHAWRTPRGGLIRAITEVMNKPGEFAIDKILQIPGVEPAVEKSVGELVRMLNTGVQGSVRHEAIIKEFPKKFEVTALEDVYRLDLRDVDKVRGELKTKYMALAMAEGAVTGIGGLLGLIADIPMLVAVNLRALGECAAYYGIDSRPEHERIFAMRVLGLASSGTEELRQQFLSELTEMAGAPAASADDGRLQRQVFKQLVTELSKSLFFRLLKGKAAQSIPVMGALVGGGFNALYTGDVCETAGFLYRERFLAAKYGRQIYEASDE